MTRYTVPELLPFAPAYFERIWGGFRLAPSASGTPIGEAWLVSDHAECQSVVSAGPHAGRTLGELVREYGTALLGTAARTARDGRFPLLLKLIDTADLLSVQVHPDDATAAALGEADGGKTEMWHVLEATPDSRIYCGLVPGGDASAFRSAMESGAVAPLLRSHPARPGDAYFVPAGMVHAIGKDILLAEIQQNSNVTYRVFDWNRVDAAGKPRQLHWERALAATHFDMDCTGPSPVHPLPQAGCTREMLCSCRFFTAERRHAEGETVWEKDTRSFHIVLAGAGGLDLATDAERVRLAPGTAAVVVGCVSRYSTLSADPHLVYFI
ncbi:MAG: class I mannose-6-phosphate isomerase [Candidatus Hydrogenedentes bacterium]|nr:class I mannose-6-phosphate isomerase [Candidatus Hydrogenedentota bacterium]